MDSQHGLPLRVPTELTGTGAIFCISKRLMETAYLFAIKIHRHSLFASVRSAQCGNNQLTGMCYI